MDDDGRPDPTGEILGDYVRLVSRQVVVPPFTAGRHGARRRPRAPAGRRALAVGAATAAIVGAVALVAAYGPRSARTGAHGVGATQRAPGSSSTTTSPAPLAPGACTAGQLTATVAFDQSGGEQLGAIRLTNATARACSLSGRPTVRVLDARGTALALGESTDHRAPDWPPPTRPIVLSPSGALPQAIVALDWIWCAASPGPVRFEIRFSGWPTPLRVPDAAVSPAGFEPATCTDSADHGLFAVDDVRGLGPDGTIGPASVAPTQGAVLGADGIGSVTVGTTEARAMAMVDTVLGRPTTTAAGDCKDRTEVEWGDLSLEFSSGRLAGYRYLDGGYAGIGTLHPPQGEPTPFLTTATGAALGMTLAQVRLLYPPGEFSEEQGGAIVVPGTATGPGTTTPARLFLGFFGDTPATPLTEIKGGGTCGDF